MIFRNSASFTIIALGLGSLTLASGLSGCKFGNYTEQQADPDPWTGYYDTAPQSVRLCANTSTSRCAEVSPNLVPDEIAVVMTNPVIFIVDNLVTRKSFFIPKTKENFALPVFLLEDGKTLSYGGSSVGMPLWGGDASCTTRIYIEEAGTLAPPRVSLHVQVIRTFDGDCAAALLARQNCYLDANQCGEDSVSDNRDRQLDTASLFDRYIDAKLMTAQDISTTVSTGYEVSYE